jgi:SAM-dependent methyltransferase
MQHDGRNDDDRVGTQATTCMGSDRYDLAKDASVARRKRQCMTRTRMHFSELFLDHRGKLVDKWEQYLEIYEREIGRFRKAKRPIRLLEIGVQNGGSLELWRKYLPQGSHIYGIDIDKRVESLEFETDHINVSIFDASNKRIAERHILDHKFDIIIDDGSHRSNDVINSFKIFFKYLNGFGIYIIEDLHCSYMKYYGGGLKKPDSSIEYLKQIIDTLNNDHIDQSERAAKPDATLAGLAPWLGRISFYDSAAVVEKLPKARTTPYRRAFSGSTAQVNPVADWVHHFSDDALRSLVLAAPALAAFDEALLADVGRTRLENAELRKALAKLKKDVRRLQSAPRAAVRKS